MRFLPGSCPVPARFLPSGRFSCPVPAPARFSCPVPARRPGRSRAATAAPLLGAAPCTLVRTLPKADPKRTSIELLHLLFTAGATPTPRTRNRSSLPTSSSRLGSGNLRPWPRRQHVRQTRHALPRRSSLPVHRPPAPHRPERPNRRPAPASSERSGAAVAKGISGPGWARRPVRGSRAAGPEGRP